MLIRSSFGTPPEWQPHRLSLVGTTLELECAKGSSKLALGKFSRALLVESSWVGDSESCVALIPNSSASTPVNRASLYCESEITVLRFENEGDADAWLRNLTLIISEIEAARASLKDATGGITDEEATLTQAPSQTMRLLAGLGEVRFQLVADTNDDVEAGVMTLAIAGAHLDTKLGTRTAVNLAVLSATIADDTSTSQEGRRFILGTGDSQSTAPMRQSVSIDSFKFRKALSRKFTVSSISGGKVCSYAWTLSQVLSHLRFAAVLPCATSHQHDSRLLRSHISA